MPVADRRTIAACDLAGCSLHDPRGACRLARGVSASDLSAVFEPGGAVDQSACPLLRGLLPQVRRLHFGEASEPEHNELLSHLYVALHDKLMSRRPAPVVNTSYVFTAVRSWVIDQIRGRGRRHQCGACRHFAPVAGSCAFPGAPYRQGSLEPASDPAELDPPCRQFAASLDFDALSEAIDPEGADAEDLKVLLGLVMEEMRRLDEEACLVFTLHRLRGRSIRWIARQKDLDRRHLGKVFLRADELFRRLLSEWSGAS